MPPRGNPQRKLSTKDSKCDRDVKAIILAFVLFMLRLADSHQLRVANPHHNQDNFNTNTSLALLSSQSGLNRAISKKTPLSKKHLYQKKWLDLGRLGWGHHVSGRHVPHPARAVGT